MLGCTTSEAGYGNSFFSQSQLNSKLFLEQHLLRFGGQSFIN